MHPYDACTVICVACLYAARVTEMLVWRDEGGAVVVSSGNVGGTCGSGIVSRAADVLGISVVRGMRGIVECVKWVCVWLGVS